MSSEEVSRALDQAIRVGGAPESITVDDGSEFASKVFATWACQNGIHLQFICPGKLVENALAESSMADYAMNA